MDLPEAGAINGAHHELPVLALLHRRLTTPGQKSQMENNCLAEMWSGSEEGACSRRGGKLTFDE